MNLGNLSQFYTCFIFTAFTYAVINICILMPYGVKVLLGNTTLSPMIDHDRPGCGSG